MLVLSRRQNEKIVFPHLGITVEILRISGSAVRVGIDAPRDVAVLREELAAEPLAETERARRDFRHKLRNRLNAANLCLYLVQKQMEQHKPQEAERTLEKALTAFAALDLEIAEATRQPGLKLPKPALRALLVEDDANESELLAGLLRISGFEVATASDGDRALDYLSAHRRPDVVLLDMFMPRCDGPSTLSAIRSNPQYEGLKVVAVSGSAPGEVGVSIGPHGVDQWFVKPIHPEKLVSRLHECLEGDAKIGAGTS
jgi:carbon storage regulator CsrA